uniref:Uncharacterized protein n=1 Tax=Oryctolagus cuniculus TaxID=9986 RepID=A0A5F9C2H6_RABIT
MQPLPLSWLDNKPKWIPQWPLTQEKLAAVNDIVSQQLEAGHLQPSTSPWNTPIFVIKKKSGKYRLLHDLRAVNQQMQPMGALQPGLPVPTMIPKHWPLIVLDLKDCFFSIPLHEQDTQRFAFTVPSINHQGPDKRYEWKVLPQGMTNSPAICQLYVDHAVVPVRQQCPKVQILHYMDDLLITAESESHLMEAYKLLLLYLEKVGLQVAPEKIQKGEVVQYLGLKVTSEKVTPLEFEIAIDGLQTLNDFQKLCGNLNWLRPYCKLTTEDMMPLFNILEGDAQLDSPRRLTIEARLALQKIEKQIKAMQMERCDPQQALEILIFMEQLYPFAVIWQGGPLLFVYPHSHAPRVLYTQGIAVADLILTAIKKATEMAGKTPKRCVVPFAQEAVEAFTRECWQWAYIVLILQIEIDNHYPRHPFVNFCTQVSIKRVQKVRRDPIQGAVTVFTDGAKGGTGAAIFNNQRYFVLTASPSPQHAELAIIATVLRRESAPMNILSDSAYVVNAVQMLATQCLILKSSSVYSYLSEIQGLLNQREHAIYIGHIRAHSNLPGPLTRGNMMADHYSRFLLACTALEQAKEYHSKWHVNTHTLSFKFNIPRKQAEDIIRSCEKCVVTIVPKIPAGANPRGLKPGHIWQMDVTHIPSFGRQSCVHVTVDTYSGVIMATAMNKEGVQQVIQHCLQAFAAWGVPHVIKTDNGPAYTSKRFAAFLKEFGISHITGIPYNPQGQAVVERAHLYLKNLIIKQKGGIGEMATSNKDVLALALYTINFLNKKKNGKTPAEMHTQSVDKESIQWVMWKDLQDNQWKGPFPLLRRVRGAVCFFPQGAAQPIWTPERRIRLINLPAEDLEEENSI